MMVYRHTRIAPVSRWLGILACCLSATAPAANLGFLKNTPISYFKQEDVDLMMKNARAALDSVDANAENAWSNPKTGASGLAQVKGQFTAQDGALCKRLRVVNKAKRVEGEATYTICKYPKRGWILNADAQPAT